MNKLCLELQKDYESLLDLIQKSTDAIWNYENKDEQESEFYPLRKHLESTEYEKLGNFKFFYAILIDFQPA